MALLQRDLWAQRSVVTTREARGKQVLVNRLVRMLITKPGTLRFHPDWGIDLEGFIGAEFDDTSVLRQIGDRIRQGLESDPEIRRGSVTVVVTSSTTKDLDTALDISVEGDSARGPFGFVTTIDMVTLELLGIARVA